jgi:signal transduction histidine kinase
LELEALIQGVIDQARPFMTARQLHLRLALAPGLGTLEIDAEKIGASLVNLMTNAIKFTPDGGQIAVRAALVGP